MLATLICDLFGHDPAARCMIAKPGRGDICQDPAKWLGWTAYDPTGPLWFCDWHRYLFREDAKVLAWARVDKVEGGYVQGMDICGRCRSPLPASHAAA